MHIVERVFEQCQSSPPEHTRQVLRDRVRPVDDITAAGAQFTVSRADREDLPAIWPCCATTSSGPPASLSTPTPTDTHERAFEAITAGSGPPSGRRAQCRRQRRRNRPPDPSAGPSPWRDPAPQHRSRAGLLVDPRHRSGSCSHRWAHGGDAGRARRWPSSPATSRDRGPPVLRPPRVCRVPRGLQASPLKTPAPTLPPWARRAGGRTGPIIRRSAGSSLSWPPSGTHRRSGTCPMRCTAKAAAEGVGHHPGRDRQLPRVRC